MSPGSACGLSGHAVGEERQDAARREEYLLGEELLVDLAVVHLLLDGAAGDEAVQRSPPAAARCARHAPGLACPWRGSSPGRTAEPCMPQLGSQYCMDVVVHLSTVLSLVQQHPARANPHLQMVSHTPCDNCHQDRGYQGCELQPQTCSMPLAQRSLGGCGGESMKEVLSETRPCSNCSSLMPRESDILSGHVWSLYCAAGVQGSL